jgi:hypothetical protein
MDPNALGGVLGDQIAQLHADKLHELGPGFTPATPFGPDDFSGRRTRRTGGLIARSAEQGAHLLERLRTVQSPLIREVRGKGLFIGVEVDRDRITARDSRESPQSDLR